jgi:hypothetical protein
VTGFSGQAPEADLRGLANDLGPGATVELRFEPAGLRAIIRFGPGAGEAIRSLDGVAEAGSSG